MKKNFNFKLTASLVSLFISFLLIVIGNKSKYCLSFGFILMSVALVFYILNRNENIDNALIEITNEIEESDIQDAYTLNELYKEKTKLIKQKRRTNFTFYLCAFLLLVVGFGFML